MGDSDVTSHSSFNWNWNVLFNKNHVFHICGLNMLNLQAPPGAKIKTENFQYYLSEIHWDIDNLVSGKKSDPGVRRVQLMTISKFQIPFNSSSFWRGFPDVILAWDALTSQALVAPFLLLVWEVEALGWNPGKAMSTNAAMFKSTVENQPTLLEPCMQFNKININKLIQLGETPPIWTLLTQTSRLLAFY